jgi:hypothetical protein
MTITGIPFIGRVHDVPSNATWLKFWQWAQEYGPIYQMEIFGSDHVFISSEEVANDLLGKRSSIYSDRPVIPNLPDNRTSGDYLPLLGHNGTVTRLYNRNLLNCPTPTDLMLTIQQKHGSVNANSPTTSCPAQPMPLNTRIPPLSVNDCSISCPKTLQTTFSS